MDHNGKTVDFYLSKRRAVAATKTFFRHAMKKYGDPPSITLDAYAVSHRAVQEWKDRGEIFYQVVEQDRRRVKRRVNPMLGFKSFENAEWAEPTRVMAV